MFGKVAWGGHGFPSQGTRTPTLLGKMLPQPKWPRAGQVVIPVYQFICVDSWPGSWKFPQLIGNTSTHRKCQGCSIAPLTYQRLAPTSLSISLSCLELRCGDMAPTGEAKKAIHSYGYIAIYIYVIYGLVIYGYMWLFTFPATSRHQRTSQPPWSTNRVIQWWKWIAPWSTRSYPGEWWKYAKLWGFNRG